MCSLQRVLAQAKNGDKPFWEEKFHPANGKVAQACTQGALLLKNKFWGKEFFPHFSLVPNVFPLGFQWIPIRFPICSPGFQCDPQHVPHSTSFLFHMLCQMLSSFHLYRWAKVEETLHFKTKPSIVVWCI